MHRAGWKDSFEKRKIPNLLHRLGHHGGILPRHSERMLIPMTRFPDDPISSRLPFVTINLASTHNDDR